jgi:hypothetical protein
MVTQRASVSLTASRRIVEILSSRDQTKMASSHRLLIVGRILRQRRMKVNMKTRECRVRPFFLPGKGKAPHSTLGEALN